MPLRHHGRTRDTLPAHIPILGQILKRAPLGLRNKQRRKNATKHKRGENLHNMIKPRGRVPRIRTPRTQRRDRSLRNDRADLARTRRNAMRRGPIPRREALAGHNESRRVGPPVEEELDQDVDPEHGVVAQVLEGEAPDDEEDGEEGEADELQRLAAYDVDCCDGEPVAWDGAGAGQDGVAGGEVVEFVVDGGAAAVADGLEYSGRIQAEAIEGYIKEEPF